MAEQAKKIATESTSGLLLLRMEIKATLDRVVQDLGAILAKVDAALPADQEPHKPRTVDEYRAMYGMGPRKRVWRKAG
jgi:hypothetical protein